MEVNIEFNHVELKNFAKHEGGLYSADIVMTKDGLQAEVSIKPRTKEWWLNVANNVSQIKDVILGFDF